MTVLMTVFPGFPASALRPESCADRRRGDLPGQPEDAGLAARHAEELAAADALRRVARTCWKGTSPSQALASTDAAWTL